MTREYCSRIHTYRTKTLSLSGPSMTEQLQPVDSSENNVMFASYIYLYTISSVFRLSRTKKILEPVPVEPVSLN